MKCTQGQPEIHELLSLEKETQPNYQLEICVLKGNIDERF